MQGKIPPWGREILIGGAGRWYKAPHKSAPISHATFATISKTQFSASSTSSRSGTTHSIGHFEEQGASLPVFMHGKRERCVRCRRRESGFRAGELRGLSPGAYCRAVRRAVYWSPHDSLNKLRVRCRAAIVCLREKKTGSDESHTQWPAECGRGHQNRHDLLDIASQYEGWIEHE